MAVRASVDRSAQEAARNRAAIAAALDPIITIDASGVVLSASDSVREVFGWTADELIGRNVSVLMPEPHRSAHGTYLAEYRRTGNTSIMGRTRRFDAVRRNGEVFPIEISVSRVDLPGELLPVFVGIMRDISAHARTERGLRLVGDLAMTICTSSTLDEALAGVVEHVCDTTGWVCGEVWVPSPDDSGAVRRASWVRPGVGLELYADSRGAVLADPELTGRVLQTGAPLWIEDPSDSGDGLGAAAGVPILSQGRAIAAMVFRVGEPRREDVHSLELVRLATGPLGPLISRKNEDENLARRRRELESRVEARTEELHAARAQLEIADRLASIGSLAAGLGHDMNNVLLPVRAHLNAILTDPGIGPDSRTHAEAVRRSADYLQQLADGLHFLAMNPDAQPQDAQPTNLRAWWAQAGAIITRAVRPGIDVDASFSEGLPAVAIPAPGLTQAVLNLVVNASEAIPADRRAGRVILRASPAEEDRRVLLTVSDDGVGMSEDVKKRVFELFYTTKPRGMGTGLGLALVRRVVQGVGGRIDIRSVPGDGTVVTLSLPAADQHRSSSNAAPTAIVSVDDERPAHLLRELARAVGARVLSVDGPDHADVWIIRPRPERLAPAQAWRRDHPEGRLVLFGENDRSSAWQALGATTIADPDDFKAIRDTLTRAVRGEHA